MKIRSTEITDTFAEAFKMSAARIIITAESDYWAMAAAQSVTGFATSVIGCRCEAGIEKTLSPKETPDQRPGVSVLLFANSTKGVGNRLVERIGQSVMTCPTTACFNGLDGTEEKFSVGEKLRYFGDGYQGSKVLNDRKMWRIPVMEGEFLIDDSFGIQAAVGGGNLLFLGQELSSTLQAATAAAEAMRKLPNIILPMPGGVVRSGSKPGSRYKALPASTNDAFCPTLRGSAPQTELREDEACVLEIVIDGLDESSVADAMRQGMHAAAEAGGEGLARITAGNYGGNLGQYKIGLHPLLQD